MPHRVPAWLSRPAHSTIVLQPSAPSRGSRHFYLWWPSLPRVPLPGPCPCAPGLAPRCSLVPLELVWGGAALLNISLLASDLWAALARFFFFGQCPPCPLIDLPAHLPARAQARPPGSLLASQPACLLLACLAARPPAVPTTRHLCPLHQAHTITHAPTLRCVHPTPTPAPAPAAGGFQGNSLLFFALSLLVVAVGIALFTWSGDVDTQLGAGSSLARSTADSGGLPVVYQRVSTTSGERLPMPSLSSSGGGKGKGAGRQALEEVQRLQQQAGAGAAACGEAAGEAGQGQQQQQQQRNPFDIAAGLRGAGGAGGFLPLAPAEGGAAPTQGSLPVAVPTAAAAGGSSSPRGSEEGVRGRSLEMETGRY